MREYPRPFSSNGLPEGPPALGSEGTLRTSGLEHPQVVPFEQQLLVALTQFLVGRQVILALNLQRLHALLAHLQRLFDGPQCSANRSGGSFGAVGDQGTILSKPEGLQSLVSVVVAGVARDYGHCTGIASERALQQRCQLALVVRHVRVLLHESTNALAQHQQRAVDAYCFVQRLTLGLGFFHALAPGQIHQMQLRPDHAVLGHDTLCEGHDEHGVCAGGPVVDSGGCVLLAELTRLENLHDISHARHPRLHGPRQLPCVSADFHFSIAPDQVRGDVLIDLHVLHGQCAPDAVRVQTGHALEDLCACPHNDPTICEWLPQGHFLSGLRQRSLWAKGRVRLATARLSVAQQAPVHAVQQR
mmetsp:Transcript_59568/g.98743  ORF Transcript_59568/g.98743 Transcript_59568/m.98743 type:complete len:359 (-) Transcript_59568:835-1911(-)